MMFTFIMCDTFFFFFLTFFTPRIVFRIHSQLRPTFYKMIV